MTTRAVLPLALASALLACSRSSPRGEPIGKRAWVDTVPRASSSASGSSAPPSSALGALSPPSATKWSETPPIETAELRAVGCRARVIAPWVRLSCGKNEVSGAPYAMIVTNVVEHLFPHRVIEEGVAEKTITIPYDVDVPLEIVVFWNDGPGKGSNRRGRAITFRWTEGAAKPPTIAVGPPEPMIGARYCACEIDAGVTFCEEETKLDCERSYENDCAALMDCAHGRKDASGALVHASKCLSGYAPREGGACVRP